MDRHKDGIARDLRQYAVKINVRANEQRIVIERLTVDLQRLRQFVDLLVRRMFGGISYQAGFKEQSQLFEVGNAAGMREEIFRHTRELADNSISRRTRNAGALTVVDLYQTFAL